MGGVMKIDKEFTAVALVMLLASLTIANWVTFSWTANLMVAAGLFVFFLIVYFVLMKNAEK